MMTQKTETDHGMKAESGIIYSDDAADFVAVSEVVRDVILEIRYYSTFNFIGDRIDGYEEPIALLTREAAHALKAAADELMEKGYDGEYYTEADECIDDDY